MKATQVPASAPYSTLAEVLAARRESASAITYIGSETSERKVPYRELSGRAHGLLKTLQDAGADAGSELVVMLEGNEPFIDAFWACVLGGIVAVPLAPGNADEHRAKLFRVLDRLHKPHLCTDRKTWDRLSVFARANGLTQALEALGPRSVFVDELVDLSAPGKPAAVSAGDLALVQYSSGSTSEPKGVALTHANLLSNIGAIIEGVGGTAGDSTLSWMPLTHDMGLIGFHLTPFAADIDQALIPTTTFVRRPALWLSKASEKKSTLLCSTNFGYKHLLANAASRDAALDLSAVRLIFNGAEPIAPELATGFLASYADRGLRASAMFPVYGLAEASLAVTFSAPETGLSTIALDRRSLGVGERVLPIASDAPEALHLATLGSPVRGCEVQIADEAGNGQPDAVVGRIRIRGPNVTSGYYHDPEATHAAIAADGWLDTGDLGFVAGGVLTVTGRIKDIIFAGGQNYYPHDLEALLAKHAGIELGRAAFCAVRPAEADTDSVLAFVVNKGSLEAFAPVAKAVIRTISEHAGLVVSEVVPVRQLPKTTSGKIKRYALAQQFESGDFAATLADLHALTGHVSGAESNPLERTLLEICQSFMRDGTMTADDNIFELGTSSLTLAQIYERIETLYPGKLEVTDFFDYPTVRSLAAYLSQRLQKA